MILFWGVLISRAGVFILSSCENQIFLTRCWEFCHSNFLKHPVGFLEVLNFWSNENQNYRLCVAVLLDRCQTFFVTGTPLAVVFILSKIKQFVNSFEVFFQPFKIFQVREFLKAARGAAGNKFSGVVPPLFPWNCPGQSPGFGVSCRHLNRLIFGFFNFLSSHMRRTRWENWPDERKLVRCDSSFIKEVSSETGNDYCLPAVVPLSGYLIFSSSSKIWRNRQ